MKVNGSLAFNPRHLLRKLTAQTISRDYRNKEAIFTQGEKADAMYYVESGNVKLTVSSKRGKKAVTAIMRQGDFFGEGCLARKSLRMSTATAIQSSIIARVKRNVIVRLIRQEPAFAKVFISFLLFRTGRVEEDFVDQIFNSSEKRLARILLMQASFGVGAKPDSTILKVSQETLAEMVGTTRSRVSHFMNRFRQMGLIDYNGSLEVHRALLTVFLQK
jgi:CRP/FNR family transcriptional regulator, cyclic AMP receptor protein